MICYQVSRPEMCRQGAVPSVSWFVVVDTPFVISDFLVNGTRWTRCFYLKHRENIQNLSRLKKIFVFYGSFQLCRGLEKMTFAQKWPRGRRNKPSQTLWLINSRKEKMTFLKASVCKIHSIFCCQNLLKLQVIISTNTTELKTHIT